MKISRKVKVFTALGFIVIFTVGGLLYWNDNYVVYEQDPANFCTWGNGTVETSTLVYYNRPHPKKIVKKTDLKRFTDIAAKKQQCWDEVKTIIPPLL